MINQVLVYVDVCAILGRKSTGVRRQFQLQRTQKNLVVVVVIYLTEWRMRMPPLIINKTKTTTTTTTTTIRNDRETEGSQSQMVGKK